MPTQTAFRTIEAFGWELGVVNEAIDWVGVSQDDAQAIKALASLVLSLVVRGKATTQDALVERLHAVAELQGSGNQLATSGIQLGLRVVYHPLPILEEVLGGIPDRQGLRLCDKVKRLFKESGF
ncbi:MAG: hypothetical protein KBD23_01620 [Gammaproteobacteria bacterium]|nr:hypothetical protein [Gammaproteobacteria bacterium]MBP9728824.1 hypothetical protein [Gammaproteobacteria bacterium]